MAWELRKLAERKKIKHIASAASLKTQISRWENGHVTPDYYQPLLCELLKATPGELGFGIQELPAGAGKRKHSGRCADYKARMDPRRHKKPLGIL